MSLGRLTSQATDSKADRPASNGSRCKRFSLYGFAATKAFIATAQTVFGSQYSLIYTFKNSDITYAPNLALTAINSLNSLIFTLATRSRQMLLPKEPISLRPLSNEHLINLEAIPDTTTQEKCGFCKPPQELANAPFCHQLTYSTGVFFAHGSRIFSALAAYNAAFVVCKTIVALTSSTKDPLESINEDPLKQSLIQIFAFICVYTQYRSFTLWQLTTVKQYILDWWLISEIRNRNLEASLKMLINLLLIASTTYFSIYSTQKGLEHLDESLTKSIFHFDIPEFITDIIVWFSATCIVSTTTFNSMPSTLEFMSKHKDKKNVELTTTGKILKISGMFDSFATSYSTTYSSIICLSKLFNLDQYNPYLITSAAIFIGIPNLIYNYAYSTRSILEKLYAKESVQLKALGESLLIAEKAVPDDEKRSRSPSPNGDNSQTLLAHQGASYKIEIESPPPDINNKGLLHTISFSKRNF